jgi:hypothetical protein
VSISLQVSFRIVGRKAKTGSFYASSAQLQSPVKPGDGASYGACGKLIISGPGWT